MQLESAYGVFHAKGSTYNQFEYEGVAIPDLGRIPTDIKQINGHTIMGLHENGPQTLYETILLTY